MTPEDEPTFASWVDGVQQNSSASAWDMHASLYDEIQGETGDAAHELVYDPVINEVIGSVTGRRILDAGCGNGCWARRLAGRASTVIGVDASAELIKLARAKVNPTNVRYEVQNLTDKLPFQDGSFDLILSSMVLHYVPSLTTMVAEFDRLLASEGEVVICVQHPMYQYHHRALATAGKLSPVFRYTVGYFDHLPLKQVTLSGKIEVPTYNRTLEDYVQIFVNGDFVLTALREPQFTEELVEVMPRYRALMEVPRVVILKFSKMKH